MLLYPIVSEWKTQKTAVLNFKCFSFPPILYMRVRCKSSGSIKDRKRSYRRQLQSWDSTPTRFLHLLSQAVIMPIPSDPSNWGTATRTSTFYWYQNDGVEGGCSPCPPNEATFLLMDAWHNGITSSSTPCISSTPMNCPGTVLGSRNKIRSLPSWDLCSGEEVVSV